MLYMHFKTIESQRICKGRNFATVLNTFEARLNHRHVHSLKQKSAVMQKTKKNHT